MIGDCYEGPKTKMKEGLTLPTQLIIDMMGFRDRHFKNMSDMDFLQHVIERGIVTLNLEYTKALREKQAMLKQGADIRAARAAITNRAASAQGDLSKIFGGGGPHG